MNFNLKSLKKKKLNIDCGSNIVITFMGVSNVNSHLAYELAQIISLSSKRIDLVFIDDKCVSEADVTDGKFLKKDLGENRADVTSRRCSASFGVNVEIIDKDIESSDKLLNIYKEKIGYFPIFICDNINKKDLILLKETINNLSDAVIIMSSEENGAGTVSLSYKKDGVFLTEDNISKYVPVKDQNSVRPVSLEMSKNIFLFVDEIILERPISVEYLKYDHKKRTTLSKYIGGEDIGSFDDISENIPVNIGDKLLCIVIGIGGTGASLAYDVTHLASVSDRDIKFVFIDGDIVEPKNLNRQRFIVSDLNRYKATVTAKRCEKAYGVSIETINDYISSSEDIYNIIKNYKGYTPIIIGCSDSLKLRYLVSESILKAHNEEDMPNDIIHIEAGNGEDYGQVNLTIIEKAKKITPSYFDESPESLSDLIDAKLVTEMSCDELMNSAPQTKAANIGAANGIYSFFYDIVKGNPIHKYMIYFNNENRKMKSKGFKAKS